jgi:proline iminopeptidase
MKKRIIRLALITFLLLLGLLAFKVFVPRHYPTPPLQKRTGTKFMELPTGSRIGYTMLAGKGVIKPFPIIYLHGGPGGRIVETNIEILSNFTNDGYDVFLYDQVGSGESSRLDNILDYTVDRHIDDLHSIIKKLGVEKVILIGQSWGGILAVFFASEYPEETDKIILTNPGPLYPYPAKLNSIKAPDSLHLKKPIFTNAQGNAKVRNLRTTAIRFFAEHFGVKLASDKEADEFETWAGYEVNKSTVFDTAKTVKRSEVKSIPSFSGYYAQVMTFKSLVEGKDPRPKLKNNTIPILVLKSQYDNQIWGGTQEYLRLFKNHQLEIIPNAGHSMTSEQPVLYLKYIRQFLNSK